MNIEPKIRFENVDKVFQARRKTITALKDISFDVMPGEFVSIVGPSGCGKSTIIRLIDEIIKPSAGDIFIDGYKYEKKVSKDVLRKIGFIFQSPNLLPWLTVKENMEFPLKICGDKSKEGKDRVDEMLYKARAYDFKDKYPSELSGGMAQRVGVYRAMVTDPEILLMDEPFGALDEVLRDSLNMELLDLWTETKKTIVLITHSISEAVMLSDRVLVMNTNPGRIVKDITIDLPRPRKLEMALDARFEELEKLITGIIGEIDLNEIV